MKWLNEFYKFLIQTFLFIPKKNIETNLNLSLTQNDYYIFMVGIWIVVIVLIWFILWMFFKFKG